MRFKDLIDKYKAVGEWGFTTELRRAVNKLADPSEVMELVDTAVKYIIDNTTPYEYKVISLISDRASYTFALMFIDSLAKHVEPEVAIKDVLSFAVRFLFADMTYNYYWMNESKEEEDVKRKRRKVDRCIELVVKYAKKYPDKLVYGLAWFIGDVDDSVEYIKRKIEKYKDQPWMIVLD